MSPAFLTAEWRKLIMAQYEVAPSALAPWLPHGVELDFYHDGDQPRCYVSLVGFLFDRVRVKGVAFPFHMHFEEVNLRFYVARTLPDGTRRRGVVFIREFVPRAAISLIARTLYEEPYRTLAMQHRIAVTPDSLHAEYSWRTRGTWSHLAVEAAPHVEAIASGSVEEFITEHYWGYTKRSNGSTSQYQVRHPSWTTYAISSCKIDIDFAALYGLPFAHLNNQQPANTLLAEGSAVSVDSGTRLR
jgi:uncharacterized protein YqjF (DUF2071 family)